MLDALHTSCFQTCRRIISSNVSTGYTPSRFYCRGNEPLRGLACVCGREVVERAHAMHFLHVPISYFSPFENLIRNSPEFSIFVHKFVRSNYYLFFALLCEIYNIWRSYKCIGYISYCLMKSEKSGQCTLVLFWVFYVIIKPDRSITW